MSVTFPCAVSRASTNPLRHKTWYSSKAAGCWQERILFVRACSSLALHTSRLVQGVLLLLWLPVPPCKCVSRRAHACCLRLSVDEPRRIPALLLRLFEHPVSVSCSHCGGRRRWSDDLVGLTTQKAPAAKRESWERMFLSCTHAFLSRVYLKALCPRLGQQDFASCRGYGGYGDAVCVLLFPGVRGRDHIHSSSI